MGFLCNLFVNLDNRDLLRKSKYKWRTRVRHFRDFGQDGYLKRVFDAKLVYKLLCVSSAKDTMLSVANIALEVGHVFDYTDSWYFEAIKHLDAFGDINIGQLLRCCDNDRRLQTQLLAKSQLNVACAGWHVDD